MKTQHTVTARHNRQMLRELTVNIPLVLQQAVLVFRLHTTELQGG